MKSDAQGGSLESFGSRFKVSPMSAVQGAIMPSTQPNPLFIGIMGCPKCAHPMRLCRIEPAAPGFDLRVFECATCDSSEGFVFRINGTDHNKPIAGEAWLKQ
jgi:hypothetical protein